MLAAADKCCDAMMQGKRYSLGNSRIMIHQPLGGAQGQVTDIEIQANGAPPSPSVTWQLF